MISEISKAPTPPPEAEQASHYDGLYTARTVDLDRRDTPTITLTHLEEVGLLHPESTLLDIGCGVGKDVRLAVSEHGFARSAGVDTSRQAICDARAITRHQMPLELARKTLFLCGTTQETIDPQAQFDLVISTSVIHLMPTDTIAGFVRSARKHLKRGGTMAIATKTTSSGDMRNVSDGGKSVERIDTGMGWEKHRCDDGAVRYYYDPGVVGANIREAGDFGTIDTAIVETPYGSVRDCEFVIVTASA